MATIASRPSTLRATLLGLSLLLPTVVSAQYYEVRLASRLSSGVTATGASNAPAISTTDGRYVAFTSTAALDPDDTNDVADIYVFDRSSSGVSRVSLKSTGAQNQEASSEPALSGDGRYVAFVTAGRLVTTDTNDNPDVYLYDRTGNSLSRLSVRSDGSQISGIYTVATPKISSDGSTIAFITDGQMIATDTNTSTDLYVHVRSSGAVTRASLKNTGTQLSGSYSVSAADISSDGRYVVFSTDGAFDTADTNGIADIYRYDRTSDIATLVSLRSGTTYSNGESTNPTISSDGDIVAFTSAATNLVSASDTNEATDVYVRAITSATTERISNSTSGTNGNAASSAPSISADGRYVAFTSSASNLVSSDSNAVSDIFVHDRTAAETYRVSVRSNGTDSDGASSAPVIAGNAQWIAFSSNATTLRTTDTNGLADVYLANTECSIDGLVVSAAADFDGDATTNCSDGCGEDVTKTAAGTCGCGVADTDSDGDATADCNDGCPSSATKTAAGSCGCSTADTDSDANGVADCLDPTTADVPRQAFVSVNRLARGRYRILVQIPNGYSAVSYSVQLSGAERATKTLRKNLRRATFIVRRSGSYSVRYRVINGATKTKFSERATVRVGR